MTPKELDFYCCLLNKRSRKRKKIDKCIQMIKLKTTNYNKNKKVYISKKQHEIIRDWGSRCGRKVYWCQ